MNTTRPNRHPRRSAATAFRSRPFASAVRFAAVSALAYGLAAAGDTPVRIDGKFEDWTDRGAAVVATADRVCFRITLPEDFTLQGGTRTTHIALDVDGKATTGKPLGDGDAALGVDVEVVLNPPNESAAGSSSRQRAGLEVRAYDDAGTFDRVSHSAIGFRFAPAYASRDYEFHVARDTKLKEPAGSRFRASTRLRARIWVEESGKTWFESAPIDVALPPASVPARYAGAIPPKPEGTVRVVSWNVEVEGPEKNPQPFARVIAALAPDVIQLQEWKTTEVDLAAWFSAHAPSEQPWRTHTYKDLGVSVVTRLPLTPLTTSRLMPARETDGKKAQPIRFVAARVDSPIGALLAGSMHLKCCGAKDTYEDRLRIAQTEAIHEFLHGVLANDHSVLPIFSGDLNLVGTRKPLENLADDLDGDGSDLSLADAYVLGADSNYTWSDTESPFSPGRLDYLFYADSDLEVAQAFVFDAARLAPDLLTRAGLEPKDFQASDHRPVVVDLRRKPKAVDAAPASPPPIVPRTGGEIAALARDGSAEVTIVNLWASWCVPCVKELPDLLRLRKERAGRVRVVLVTCDGSADREKAAAILARLGVDFESYIKSGSEAEFIDAIDPAWEGTLPMTLVYDRSGKMRLTHQGQATYEEFAALADAGAKPADH